MPDPVGVAIVTGGSSGIGLALTSHLVAKHWHVFNLDLQPPVVPVSPDATTFIKTDVSQWEDLAAAFEAAFAKFHRLDFCALNAGIDDRDDIFATISRDPAKPPRKPSMLTFEVNLNHPYYGLKLAAHYMSLPGAGHPPGGKVVVTASACSFYEQPVVPQYTASKFGVLGLVRAIAPVAAARAGIRVNCVCPSFVRTGMMPQSLSDVLPDAATTPMAAVVRAVDELADFDALAREGRAQWVAGGPNGAAVELIGDKLSYREGAKPQVLGEEDGDGGGGGGREEQMAKILKAWEDMYAERNQKLTA